MISNGSSSNNKGGSVRCGYFNVNVNKNRKVKITCLICGKPGNIELNYWSHRGSVYGEHNGDNNETRNNIPGVDSQPLHWSPRSN